MNRRHMIALGLAAMAAPRIAQAGEAPVFARNGFAIRGYDPVAYFDENGPVEGSDDFTVEHEGATWRFVSAENRDKFAADPARWAPQYGGYCAYAVSRGYTAKTEPDAWHIEDGRLYLNFNKTVRALWRLDIPGNIEAANANWPEVLG